MTTSSLPGAGRAFAGFSAGWALFTLASVLMLVALPLLAQQLDWLRHWQASSSEQGHVLVDLAGGSGCRPSVAGFEVTAPDELVIELATGSVPGGGCFSAPIPYELEVDFGPLPAGAYRIVIMEVPRNGDPVAQVLAFDHDHVVQGGPVNARGVPVGGLLPLTVLVLAAGLWACRRRLVA
ncbi:MAG: hypothetical protein M0Q42_07800 [Xanthomonadales bacterium]|nr:hypothetical protein [Xanthomonadales bacterium]